MDEDFVPSVKDVWALIAKKLTVMVTALHIVKLKVSGRAWKESFRNKAVKIKNLEEKPPGAVSKKKESCHKSR